MKKKETLPSHFAEQIEEIKNDGVKILSVYQEPYKGQFQIFALIPIEMIKAAPFQRNLSEPHVRKLAEAITRAGRYLDPIIVVRNKKGEYWTPNGHHRKEAAQVLGIKELPVILLLEEDAGRYVLAMNVEKAHTVKDKSLEVIKLYEELLNEKPEELENEFAAIFESGAYATMGLLYREKEKFSGSAYENLLKKIDNFFEEPISKAYKLRQDRAKLLYEVDAYVEEKVNELKERGITHPFLKAAVVSSANPIKRRKLIEASYEEILEKLKDNLLKVSEEKISKESVEF
jgi:ParB family chromosome partitioning protein